MFAIIGIVVVFGAVIGGFMLSHGQLPVLWQPNEFIVIFGAAIGTLLIANPMNIVIGVFKGILGILKGSPYNKKFYLDALKMLNEIFAYARKNGMAKLEQDVDDPHKSALFSKYPALAKNHHALDFVCDSLRTAISGGIGHFELDQTMEGEIDLHHHESSQPITALNSVADALPGLGIVAAVLGIVITMGSLGGPPEEIGHHVAAALVGTFIGILMSYGVAGPLASNMTKIVDAESEFFKFLRAGVMAFIKGAAPILAVETARRTIPGHVRPTFKEMEAACKGGGAAA
ncbi:MAG: flagellar motor stator protein MotA [Acidobacteria bacterium]|nr:flagellar motor stator protein MotA [Acidobacteriota bacterium]